MRVSGMPTLRHVPVLPFTISALAGVSLALHFEISPRSSFTAMAGIALLAGFSLASPRFRRYSIFALCALVVLLATYRGISDLNRGARRQFDAVHFSEETVFITGKVCASRNARDVETIWLEDVEVTDRGGVLHGENLFVRLHADSMTAQAAKAGDWISANGYFSSPLRSGDRSRGGVIAAISSKLLGTFSPKDNTVVLQRQNGSHYERMVERARRFIRRVFDTQLSPDGAALCKALVLGDRSDFEAEFSHKLRLTGLSHVFALSGVNVGVVVTVVWILLGALFIPRLARLVTLLAIIVFYMELGGEAPSLVRASLMAGIYVIGLMLYRKASPYNCIAAAAFIEILWHPLDIIDAGFILSYLSVTGIISGILLYRTFPIATRPRIGTVRTALDMIVSTVSAQIATMPAVGYLFSRFPMLGIVGNFAAIPLFGIMLIWALLLLLGSVISSHAGMLLAEPINGVAYLAGQLVEFASAMPFASIQISNVPASVIALIYLAIIIATAGFFLKNRRLSVLSILIAANLAVWFPLLHSTSGQDCRLTFLPVGQGDAVVISTNSGKNLLIDAGPVFGSWSAADRITHWMSENHLDALDGMILTHSDADHIGGAAEILRKIPTKNVYANLSDETAFSCALCLTMESMSMSAQPLYSGDVIGLGHSVKLTVLSPDKSEGEIGTTDNARSIVTILNCGGATALLTGDADSSIEKNLIAWGAVTDCELLKVSHHGSKSATIEPFLDHVTPDFAIVSVGTRSLYGHPDSSVMKRLTERGIPVFVTARHGAVTFVSSNGQWHRELNSVDILLRQWKLNGCT